MFDRDHLFKLLPISNQVQVRSLSLIAATVLCAQPVLAQGPDDRYYRFEDLMAPGPAGGPNSVVDAYFGSADGSPFGTPSYSADVPMAVIPQTGASNTLSMELTGGGVSFTSQFIFHSGFGDATVEFFIKPTDQTHRSLIWSRDCGPDADRFHIALNSGGGLGLDYREATPASFGTLHFAPGSHVSGMTMPLNVWSHVAIVRDVVSMAPGHEYRFYLDGVLQHSQVDPSPNLPGHPVWQISSSHGCSPPSLVGLIDELRMTASALDPSEFLGAGPGLVFSDSCSGDGGDQMGCTNCPCMNNAPPGTTGGCLNSTGGSTRLRAAGDPSVSLPTGSTTDLQLEVEGAPPSSTNVLLSGNAVAPQNMANPCFGQDSGVNAADRDGLRCIVQSILRHGNRSANLSGDIQDVSGPHRVWGGPAQPNAGIAGQAGFAAGQTRYFQVTHRDVDGSICPLGTGLNTSQVVEVTFTP